MARRRLASGAAVAAAIAIAGCFGGGARDRVEDYLNQVRDAQAPAKGFERATSIYRRVAEGEIALGRALPRLERAQADIDSVREAVGEIEPPAEAERLHELVLRVFDLDAEMAAETAGLARFLPAAKAAGKPLGEAGRRMSAGLRSARIETRTRALDRYGDELGDALARLRELKPPGVLQASHERQLKRLGSVRRLALRLGNALRREDAGAVASLLTRFGEATSGNLAAGIDRRSVRAYNRRYRGLTEAMAAVRREQTQVRREILDL